MIPPPFIQHETSTTNDGMISMFLCLVSSRAQPILLALPSRTDLSARNFIVQRVLQTNAKLRLTRLVKKTAGACTT
jgi:hypothetical protein